LTFSVSRFFDRSPPCGVERRFDDDVVELCNGVDYKRHAIMLFEVYQIERLVDLIERWKMPERSDCKTVNIADLRLDKHRAGELSRQCRLPESTISINA
jgi:hypothetical protein